MTPLPAAADVPLATVGEVAAALATTFKGVRSGEIDAKVGNCLGLLAGQLLRALQESELAEEMAKQAEEMTKLRTEIAEMRRHDRHAKKAIAATTNGTGGAAHSNSAEPVLGSNPSRRRGDNDEGGDDAGCLADDVMPFAT